jgi:hypothetical protein
MAEFNLQGFQPYDIQQQRIDLSTPSPETLRARAQEDRDRKKHEMFLRGLSVFTGRKHRSNISYPDYGTSSKSQSAAIEKQINIDFMQAVDKIYKERGRLTEDELMTIGRAYNAGPAQYRLLKEMMPFIGIDRKEVAEQEEAASEARGAVVYDKAAREHLRLIRDATPATVGDRVAEAIYDINNSTLSPARKNAIREKYLAVASQAHALGKSARGEERELAEIARKASENKTERLIIYNALKKIKEVNTSGTYRAEDGVITAMTPGMTMQREREILADAGEEAFTAGVDIKKVQDGITSGIVKAPSTKEVIDLQAADPSQPYVFVSDRDIALANAVTDRYVPVQDKNNLTDSFKISAIAAMSELGIDQAQGLQALQLMDKVGPFAAMQQRADLRDIISRIAVHVKKNQNILGQIFGGQFKQGSPSEPRVRVLQ